MTPTAASDLGLLPAARLAELETFRLALYHRVDLYIDNLIDDGREGGLISQLADPIPTVQDALDEITEMAASE